MNNTKKGDSSSKLIFSNDELVSQLLRNYSGLGQITSVVTNTMENMADVSTRVIMLTLQGIFATVVITALVLCYDWRIGLVAVAGIILLFAVNSILQKRSRTLAPVKSESDTDVVAKVLEYVQGISEVRSYNLTGRTTKKLNDAIEESRRINTEMELTFVPLMQVQNGIIKLTGVVMTMLSIYLYLRGSMVLLNCIGMIICSFLVLDSLGTAGNYSSLLRVVDIKDVDFYYDKDQTSQKTKIIDDVSVHITEKTTTAIVGPSGGGKTTLCHLIARFWDVDRGTITLGGENVKNYSMDSLMKNFSFVFQNVYLFPAVRDRGSASPGRS